MNIILDFFLLFSHSHPSLLPSLAFCSVRSLPLPPIAFCSVRSPAFPCLPLPSVPFDPLHSLLPSLAFCSVRSLAFPCLPFPCFLSFLFPSLPFPCLALNKLYLLTIQIARMVAGISMEFMIKKLKNLFPPSNTEPKETP